MDNKGVFEYLLPDFDNQINVYLENQGFDPQLEVWTETEHANRVSAINELVSRSIEFSESEQNELPLYGESNDFLERFNKTWGKCFRLSRIYLFMIQELCDNSEVVFDDENIKKYVIAKLMGKGIRTYIEISTLLEHGFPYGAAALTRNMLELMTITRFIELNDKTVARAYYEASSKPIEKLGYDNYGWARSADKFKDKKKVHLSDIQRECNLLEPKWKEIYRFLSQFVHADPFTVNIEIGSDDDNIYIGNTMNGIDVAGTDATLFLLDILIRFTSPIIDQKDAHRVIFCAEWATLLCKEYTLAAEKNAELVTLMKAEYK